MNSMNAENAELMKDVLICKVVCNQANAIEWSQFEGLASNEVGAWEELARTFRDEMQMREALDTALAPADAVDVPSHAFDPSPIAHIESRTMTRWSGWAIAAMIAIAWIGSNLMLPGVNRTPAGTDLPAQNVSPANGENTATLASYSDPDQAYHDYLRLGQQQGRVVQELPMVMIESRQIEGGDDSQQPVYEVFYVRQLLERTRVNQAFEMNRDERGRQVPVKVDFASFQPESDL